VKGLDFRPCNLSECVPLTNSVPVSPLGPRLSLGLRPPCYRLLRSATAGTDFQWRVPPPRARPPLYGPNCEGLKVVDPLFPHVFVVPVPPRLRAAEHLRPPASSRMLRMCREMGDLDI